MACSARMRSMSPNAPTATAGITGKSAMACMSGAQGRSARSKRAVIPAVQGIPQRRCSFDVAGKAADMGAIVKGSAPSSADKKLMEKRRMSMPLLSLSSAPPFSCNASTAPLSSSSAHKSANIRTAAGKSCSADGNANAPITVSSPSG